MRRELALDRVGDVAGEQEAAGVRLVHRDITILRATAQLYTVREIVSLKKRKKKIVGCYVWLPKFLFPKERKLCCFYNILITFSKT